MRQSLRQLGVVVALLIVAGVAGAVWASRGTAPSLQTIDEQFASIARQYGLEPVLPPMSRVRLASVSIKGEREDCWDAQTISHPSYQAIETVSAAVRNANSHTTLEFLREVGFSFTAGGNRGTVVRLILRDWSVEEATQLRFKWENDECWRLLEFGSIPVIGRALQFGRVRTEILDNSGKVVKIDTFSLREGVDVASTSTVSSTNSHGSSVTATSVTVGVGIWRFAVRQWKCPSNDSLVFRPGDGFRAIDLCPSSSGARTATWYRLRLRRQNDHLIAYFQKVGQGQDNFDSVRVTPGIEQTLSRRVRTTDRLLVEAADSGFVVSVIRYELWPTSEVNPGVVIPTSGEPREFNVGRPEKGTSAAIDPLSYHKSVRDIDSLALFSREFSRDPFVGRMNPNRYVPSLTNRTASSRRSHRPYTDLEADQPFRLYPQHQILSPGIIRSAVTTAP